MRVKFFILLLSWSISQASYSSSKKEGKANSCQIIFNSLTNHNQKLKSLSQKNINVMSSSEKVEVEDTLYFFSPLAQLLGMDQIQKDMENTAFQIFYPKEYNDLKDKIQHLNADKEAYVHHVKNSIDKHLKRNGILKFDIINRYKHLYSIHRKMKAQNLSFEEVYDIVAFRILVETKDEAYGVLKVIHRLWDSVPVDFQYGSFKDYIAHPKSNGYQSLHTVVSGPKGHNMEIQIRTYEMDEFAKNGPASHWDYKNNGYLDYMANNEYFQELWEKSFEIGLDMQKLNMSFYEFLASPYALFWKELYLEKKEEDTD